MQLESPDHKAALEQLYTYMDMEKSNYSVNSVRSDDNLSVYSNILGSFCPSPSPLVLAKRI